MSAFVVSKRDIDAIVTVALCHGLAGGKSADELGRMLWAENVKSVAWRYQLAQRDPAELAQYEADVEAYRFETLALAPGAARKIADCYDYQSCEHDDYEMSEAQRLARELEDYLPKDHDYEAMSWGLPDE